MVAPTTPPPADAFADAARPLVTVEQFLATARAGFTDEVKKILLRQPDLINKQDSVGDTALIEAVRNARYDTVTALLEAKANPDTPNSATFFPLILAVMAHDLKMVTLLLEHKANPDLRVDLEVTGLMLAAIDGEDAIVEQFLKHKAAKEMTTDGGDTAVMQAASNGRASTVRLLKKYGANIDARDKEGESSLDRAISRRDDAMFDLLIELGADFKSGNNKSTDPVKSNTTPAMWAAAANNTHALQKLKELGAPVETWNGHGMTPLIFSAINNAFDTAKQLLDWDVSLLPPDPRKHSARRHAELKGFMNIVQLFDLVNGRKVAQAVSGAQVNGEGVEAPQKAAFKKTARRSLNPNV